MLEGKKLVPERMGERRGRKEKGKVEREEGNGKMRRTGGAGTRLYHV